MVTSEQMFEKFLGYGLSRSEARSAVLVAQGLSTPDISEILKIKEKSVKFHLTKIYWKFDVKTRVQFILKCMSLGFYGQQYVPEPPKSITPPKNFLPKGFNK